jgi:hypothetical protein
VDTQCSGTFLPMCAVAEGEHDERTGRCSSNSNALMRNALQGIQLRTGSSIVTLFGMFSVLGRSEITPNEAVLC